MAEKYIKGSGKGRGGWRGGGRKKGVKIGKSSDKTETFNKRLTLDEKIYLSKCLEEYRQNKTE